MPRSRQRGSDAATASVDWTTQVSDALQRLIGHLSTESSSPSVVESLLARIPKPRRAVERIFLGLLVYETASVLIRSRWAGRVSDKRLDAALEAIAQIRRSQNPIALLAIVIQQVTNASGITTPDDRTLDPILAFIQEHYAKKLTAKTVGQYVNMSPKRVNRTLRRALGMSLRVYVRALRVQQGLSLVAKGVKVKAAALAVGYGSRKDFYRAVRMNTGGTPRQPRHRVRSRSESSTK